MAVVTRRLREEMFLLDSSAFEGNPPHCAGTHEAVGLSDNPVVGRRNDGDIKLEEKRACCDSAVHGLDGRGH